MSDTDVREYVCYVDGRGMHLRAPAEEIVRCQDCEHGELCGAELACALRPLMKHWTRPNAFCSDGRRKEVNE